MRIGHIELFVNKPLEARSLHEDVLGFELVANQNNTHIWLKCADVEILLRQGRKQQSAENYQATNSTIVRYTDAVQETASQLRRRGLVFKGTDGSPDCLTFTDPDGNWFQLVNPEHP